MEKNYFIISFVFAAISIAMFVTGLMYGFTSEVVSVLKPITVFQYSTFLWFAFFVTSFRKELERSKRLQAYLIIGFFVAMATFYEVLFNFFYWFSLYNFYGLGVDLDSMRNTIQMQKASIFNITNYLNLTNEEMLRRTDLYPVNLNLASKIILLMFFGSLYWIHLIHSIMRSRNKKT